VISFDISGSVKRLNEGQSKCLLTGAFRGHFKKIIFEKRVLRGIKMGKMLTKFTTKNEKLYVSNFQHHILSSFSALAVYAQS
jgi:hypothetical protein